MHIVSDTLSMVAQMKPALQSGEFVFCSTESDSLKDKARLVALASFAEDGGLSFILPLEDALRLGFSVNLKNAPDHTERLFRT